MSLFRKFKILDPSTWDKATDKPIIYNGMLYNNERRPITERDIVGLMSSIWAFLERKGEIVPIEKKIQSIKKMLENMTAAGQTDPNWIDREKTDPVKEEEPPKPPAGSIYGGYAFSEAQMEVVSGFSEDQLVKIGEIMVSGRKNHKRSYQIKQDFFNGMGWDAYHFVQLDSNKGFPELEEKTMWDYFWGYEDFETEKEIRDFFEANEYLKKHPKMREELIESKIEYLE